MSNLIPDEEAIFNAARQIGDPAARAAYMIQACRGAEALRARVEDLLSVHDNPQNFLRSPVIAQSASDLDVSTHRLPPGTVIGRYKLLEPIGEGGYGTVFMAEQSSPVQRKVALKIIKAGMDTRQVIARFEAERQALALMDHPNIAKVFDAGRTDTGRPYFVMELVKGVPITKYCDAHRVEPRRRLELFMQVCQAVQHAHQKGIIHRDLKPSNVLVALYDGTPVPKVIDFGVAKATGQQLTDLTMFTGFGDVIGTLEYMSPEQAEVNQLDVDTRSDIYSLGVLLYELLTGTTPLEHNRVIKAGLLEMLRVVREEEPERPSTRLNSSEQLASISANRGMEPRKLSGLLKGELDWIVMKALEKDRGRRYETANGLVMDIQHYLHDEPVLACPPSAGYRLRTFIRRNKASVLAGCAIAVALIIGLILASVGLLKARHQAQIAVTEASKANLISDLLQTALQAANPEQAKGSDYTVRRLLDDFSAGLGNQLVGRPEVEAKLRAVIGNAYGRLELGDLAAAQFETALALQRRVGGAEKEEYAELLLDYAQVLPEQLRWTDGERNAREAVLIYRRAGVSGRPLVKALWILQLQLAKQFKYEEEEATLQEALAIAEAERTEYPELASMLHRHAPMMSSQGDHAGAEKMALRAIDMHRRLQGNEHPETAYGLTDLAKVLRNQEKYPEAEAAFREALAIFRRQYGDKAGITRAVRAELQGVIRAQDDPTRLDAPKSEPSEALDNSEPGAGSLPQERSLRLAQDALERELRDALKGFATEIASSPDNRSLRLSQASTYHQVGAIDARQGRLNEAIDEFQTAVDIASQLAREDPDHSSYAEERAGAQLSLARTLGLAHRTVEALAGFDTALTISEEAMAKFSHELWLRTLSAETCIQMAVALPRCADREPHKSEQAHRLFRRALQQLDRVSIVAARFDGSLEAANLYIRVGGSLAPEPDWSEELGEIERRFLAQMKVMMADSPSSPFARMQVGHRLRNWAFVLPWNGRYQASAKRAFEQAITVFERLTVDFPGHPAPWHFLPDTHRRLGQLHELAQSIDEAETAYRRAVELFDERAATFDAAPIGDSERAASYVELASFLVRHARLKGTSAADLYRRACEIAPDNPGVLNSFAWWLATTPDTTQRNPTQAVELADKAIQLCPGDGNFWQTLGVARYRSGDLRQAVTDLQKSIQLSKGGTSVDFLFLAMSHWQLGDKDQARQWYHKAVVWMDTNEPRNEELIRFRADAAELIGIGIKSNDKGSEIKATGSQ